MSQDATAPGWLERLALVATSFRRVGMGRLGDFVIKPEAVVEQAQLKAALGAEELVYLATCNRVECYALLPTPARHDALEAAATGFFAARGAAPSSDALLVLTGRDVVHHLFTVMSSLDSLVLGETEIAGQARRAADRCQKDGLSGPVLARLFERGLGCSRRVRGETALGRSPTSAASIAVSKIKACFGAEGPGVTLLVGAGEMTVKVATALAGRPGERVFVNRTKSKAEELAARFGGRALSLDELLAAPLPWVDLVFAATAATETVIPKEALAPALAARKAAGERRPMIVCDLGLPRDVDPALDGEEGVVVVDMRVLEGVARSGEAALRVEAEKARGVVAEETDRLAREDRFRVMAGESLRAVIGEQLAHLSEEDQALLLGFATGLAGRFARQPLSLAS